MVKKKKLVKAKPRVKSATKKALSQKDNNHGDSTASLARDQCSPWTSGDQDEPTMDPINYRLEQVLALNALQLGEPRSSSPTTSPQEKATATPLTQTGPTIDHVQSPPRQPLATIDKKKMQLHRLRANIRREMREEKSSTTDTNYV
ncbi:hypothetical protein PHYBOEH_011914 [Phytophthora boehmeriae]|uniref:Uncharacterized protein n=1 Tax=Phytophthora boehmeriae TaxID=109152 RepID=A0A8T1WWJ5_9STRA|nr:hypothetical protein PHYBOEH_011914 [Phytophthora boehmeriae]